VNLFTKSMRWTERVHLRVIQCPECSTVFCWVNGRFPSYCPVCGKMVYPKIKQCVMHSDDKAELRYRSEND